jgi:hypothetical protein
MRIIKAGKPPSSKPLQGSCPECGCKFEFTEKEGTYEPRGPRPDDGDFYRVKCPQKGCIAAVIVYR